MSSNPNSMRGASDAAVSGSLGADAPAPSEGARPAIFLDRDGVINIDHAYVYRVEDLAFTPTAIPAIRMWNDAGYLVVVVTNQSGVARGYYTAADVERFHDVMQDRLREAGAHIDAFYYCPYHPDGTVEAYARHHEDRKPGAGMLLQAMRDLAIDRAASLMIGDKDSDMAAAAAAGVAGRLVEANTCDLAAEARRMLDQRRASTGPA